MRACDRAHLRAFVFGFARRSPPHKPHIWCAREERGRKEGREVEGRGVDRFRACARACERRCESNVGSMAK